MERNGDRMSGLRSEKARDRAGATIPICRLTVELPSAGAGQRVVLRPPRARRRAPFGVDCAGALEPLQCREQRSGVDLEDAARDLLDPLADAEAVERLQTQGLQDQHVQRSLNNVRVGLVHTSRPLGMTRQSVTSPPDCQDMTLII